MLSICQQPTVTMQKHSKIIRNSTVQARGLSRPDADCKGRSFVKVDT